MTERDDGVPAPLSREELAEHIRVRLLAILQVVELEHQGAPVRVNGFRLR